MRALQAQHQGWAARFTASDFGTDPAARRSRIEPERPCESRTRKRIKRRVRHDRLASIDRARTSARNRSIVASNRSAGYRPELVSEVLGADHVVTKTDVVMTNMLLAGLLDGIVIERGDLVRPHAVTCKQTADMTIA